MSDNQDFNNHINNNKKFFQNLSIHKQSSILNKKLYKETNLNHEDNFNKNKDQICLKIGASGKPLVNAMAYSNLLLKRIEIDNLHEFRINRTSFYKNNKDITSNYLSSNNQLEFETKLPKEVKNRSKARR